MNTEVTIDRLTQANFALWHGRIAEFASGHSEHRVRQTSLDWLRAVTPYDMEQPGTLILFALSLDALLVGVTIATPDVLGPNFTVVHESHRRVGIGSALVRAKLVQVPKYATLVAPDNAPSLKLMFSAGLVATALVSNGAGRSVLRFATPDLTNASAACILGSESTGGSHAK